MSLKLSQVEHLARLAKLELSDEERDWLPRQLGEILKHFELLSELGIEPGGQA